MNQTFNTLFKLYENTVFLNIDNFSFNNTTNWIFALDAFPWIWKELFVTQTYTLTLSIKFQNHNIDFIVFANHFFRMTNTSPSHICNVQQTINSTKINKHTIFCDVLDFSTHDVSNLQLFQRFCTFDTTCFFQQRTTRKYNVSTFLVELNDAELEITLKQLFKILHWT